jgi:Holliday junction resolvasome RuvABC endonuclease subunit
VVAYSPTEVKKVVGGYGQAGKDQVFYMVKLLLSEPDLQEGADASDALALAICHIYASRLQLGSKKKKQSLSQALSHAVQGKVAKS